MNLNKLTKFYMIMLMMIELVVANLNMLNIYMGYYTKNGEMGKEVKTMTDNELRLTMIVNTFRDRLIELDEQDFINWVEKTQFPKKEV